MDHAETLRRHQHVRNLQDDAHGLLLRLRPAERDRGTEGVPLDVVHHEEVDAPRFVISRVMDRHEVGVAYPRGELGFADKPFHVLGLRLRHLRIKHLDCEQGVEHVMPSEPNGPQPALADLLFNHVAVKRVARVEHGALLCAEETTAFIYVLSLHGRTL